MRKALAIASLLCACSSGAPTIGSVAGGRPIVEINVVADVFGSGQGSPPTLAVGMSDDPAYVCELITAGEPRSAQFVSLLFFGSGGADGGFPIGSYPIAPNGIEQRSSVAYGMSDSNCKLISPPGEVDATSGSLTLSRVGVAPGAPVEGSFDVTLPRAIGFVAASTPSFALTIALQAPAVNED